jgi:transposase
MNKDNTKKRNQIQFFPLEDLIPKNHLLRLIDKAINFDFIYDLVEDKYSTHGRPSLDPVLLIKLPLIQYLYGIKSMRQTIKDIEVNIAYRWFLGLDITSPVPHFSTFGKNYTRRFKDTDLFEKIFQRVLEECFRWNFVDPSITFVDATHIKACANKRKAIKKVITKETLFYKEDLKTEIEKDRYEKGKNPLKDKDDEGPKGGQKFTTTVSTVDPESGLFRKGEHKQVFAYTAQTACDKNGWILGYTIHPGNEHDSRTFIHLYNKIKTQELHTIVADAGYKNPAIARMIIKDGIKPIFPYTRPMTKKGFFKKNDYVYDEYNDCYLCPENKTISYSTTNREGYKEYKSNNNYCSTCPSLSRCTHSKNHVKVVTRHVWEEYIEEVEDIRHQIDSKETYNKRKETIERIFGDAKENHGMRYTHYIGKARMKMKIGLTFACINLKKLANLLHKRGVLPFGLIKRIIRIINTLDKYDKRVLNITC